MSNELGKLRNVVDSAAYVREKYAQPCTKGLLDKLAVSGNGPLFRKAGRFRVYEERHLDEWALSRLSAPVRSTAEADSTLSPERRNAIREHRIGARSTSQATEAA